MNSTTPAFGVIGIVPDLPSTVPSERLENAGNMVHGQAPLSMFPGAYHAGAFNWPGARDGVAFHDFVNQNCSHVIYTMANILTLNTESSNVVERFKMMKNIIERFEVPIVAFGVGAQSQFDDLSAVKLTPAGVDALRTLAERAQAISVRGDFTAGVFRKYADDKKVFITGCPSFFSRPEAFSELRARINGSGRCANPTSYAYNGTRYESQLERPLLKNAIDHGHFLVEPLRRDFHQFYVDAMRDPSRAEPPTLLATIGQELFGDEYATSLRRYFESRYRFFRSMSHWTDFNRELVDLTYGTRFHVNMASLLSGIPAVWLTHDSRTRELVRTLNLPGLALTEIENQPIEELVTEVDFTPLFDTLHEKFDAFNDFLEAAGLPKRELAF